MSARTKVPELADKAFRAPLRCRSMVPKLNSGIVEAFLKPYPRS